MSIRGNKYADKVFSEHPISLWPLDESAYYLSLINDNDRLFSNWNLTNATYDDSPTLPDASSPFNDDVYSSISANTDSPILVEAESPELFSSSDIDIENNTFCVNMFLYQKPDYINWFKVGYRYEDALGNPQEVISSEISAPQTESWINFNNVYDVPSSWSGNIKIFIQVNFADSSGGDITSRTIIMNGLSIGQDSETTCYESLGNEKISLPESMGYMDLFGIPADQYGLVDGNGYYVVRNNRLLAKNDGFPMVYGTNHSTKIYSSNVGLPSFIFPGKGMLNESGRNKNYTLEMWMKISPSTNIAQRIVGPISTTDGIYVKEGFITLVIGSEIGSHCIGEWHRPMLVDLVLKDGTASLILNGELVISIPYDKTTIDLPNDKDWWGIYSYPSFSSFSLDCVSVYPYSISEVSAKRRFVYGQGTPSIQNIDDGFLGSPTTIDFSTSKYNSSALYPDIYRWDAGYFNNLNANRNFISVPNYQLPLIDLGESSLEEWYRDNYTVNTLEYPERNHPNFITFRPNITYDINGDPLSWDYDGNSYTDQSYLNFPSLNILNNAIASVYGVFETEEDIAEDRTLMSFVNVTNGETFNITINSDTISYSINGNVIHEEIITIGTEALVGINFELAGTSFGYEVSRFFSSPSSVQLYVGGNGQNTFEGKIYVIGFCNQLNNLEISENFDSNGIAISENYEILIDHIASYTLIPEYEYGKLFLDVSVSSEWQEYYPLTYFASYVKDENGNLVYDLDMIQLNIAYSYVETEGTWIYEELNSLYSGQDYSDLSSGYTNYFNLYKNNTVGEAINISNSSLQSYVTFQPLEFLQEKSLLDFSYTKNLSLNSVIFADDENTIAIPEKVYDTKFVVKDNTIIYPPKTNNFEDYAMVLYFNIKQRSILKNPLTIRGLEITSKNLNYVSLTQDPQQRNYIGTKFGKNIYPEKIESGQVDYKEKNPIFIYKTGTPYLYTTDKSGIQLVNQTPGDEVAPAEEYLISIPVNENGSFDFSVGAIQFFISGKYEEQNGMFKLMDVNHKDGKISIVLDKNDSGSFIRAYNNDGTSLTEINNIDFYQNGRYVINPKIINDEWDVIGIAFPEQLDFSEYFNGSIDIFGGALFNNISYYLAEGLGIKTDLEIRTWENVLNYESTTRLWSFWDSGSQTWRDIYVLGQSTSFFNSPADIYYTYTGTNKNIVDDGYGVVFNKTESSIYTDIVWSTITGKPA